MLRPRLLLVMLTVVFLVPVASAGANAYLRVLQVYELTGTVPPCTFSSAQLASALKETDPYGTQYFADFTNAIQQALAQRGSGRCQPRGGTLAVPSTAAAPAGSASPGDSTAPLGPLTAATSSGLPAAIVLMGLAAAAFALIAGAAAAGRRRAWAPAWALGWRHAWQEAGFRVGGTWAEFVDWLRSA